MDKIDELLTRGVEKIYPSREALEKLLRSGKKLRLYQGFDPSMPSLHLGNLVGVQKLRQFQELGHEVIFLVGDFTGMIGDPTDRSATRRQMTREETRENAAAWKDQAGKILQFSGRNPAKILFNSEWLDKVSFKDLINITSNFTVQQMIERDFFQKRLEEKKPIYLHEFLYPVAQAVDSVMMDVDLEIGGSDQTFNMLAGRTLMAAMKDKEKFVLTTKLLVDNQGNKVGKTAGNALFLNADPEEIFGGVMAFPDEVILLSFELLTMVSWEKLREIKKRRDSGENPMTLKKELAGTIVTELFGADKAKKAREEFEKTFQKRELDTADISTTPLASFPQNPIGPVALILQCVKVSNSEAKRLLEQGAVEINGKAVSKEQKGVRIKPGDILKVGKRKFFKFI